MMKQVLQNLRSGETSVVDVPAPGLGRNTVLIRTRASLISAGTERMLVEFGKAGLIGKAKAQPEKVKQVLDKIKTDGLLPTLDAVFNRLDEPLPLGYCNAGVVVEVGAGVSEFRPGDRVVSNGPHAEIVAVPKALCAKIPDGVSDEQAAFTVLASIGLQGIRLASPTLGERVAVVGLGLIGLVTVQLLRASGCAVLGIDVNPGRLELARKVGAEVVNGAAGQDPVTAAMAWSDGKGVDAVIITASARSDEIMHQAAQMSRKRGRIVLVGVVGLNLHRGDFYDKELTFQVSCSYGPGRYDEKYEQGDGDYPFGFVRWTEQRNFQAVLDMLASSRLSVAELITDRYPIANAPTAYDRIRTDGGSLGVILQYPADVEVVRTLQVSQPAAVVAGEPVVGVIGAGVYGKVTLMPALGKIGANVRWIADLNGAAAGHLASKFKAAKATTDYKQMLADPAVNALFVAVRHNLHSRFVIEALAAGKHVFIEKPLALNVEQLRQILDAVQAAPGRMVMVGFNRRFSPHIVRMKQLLAGRSEPLCMNMLVNAGAVPPDHWVNDPEVGGGRIVGEGCHFIDLMSYLAGSPVASVAAATVGQGPVRDDKMSIVLTMADGSVGTVNYFANGPRNYPKEQVQVFSEGRVLEMVNFRRTVGYGFKGFGKLKTFRQDKGHAAEFAGFLDRVRSASGWLIPLGELVNITLASFAAVASAADGRVVTIDQEYSALLAAAGAK